MKVAILGSTSFLGRAVKELLSKRIPNVQFLEFSRKNNNLFLSRDFDFEKFIENLINQKPEIIINCVGAGMIQEFKDVSRATLEKDFITNAEFPAKVFLSLHNFEELKFALNLSSVSVDLPSPLFASYAASKAYASKIIETINSENLAKKMQVVITDAHLFNFKSSSNFSGGNNVPSSEEMERIGKTIDAMFNKQMIFYEEGFLEVLEKSKNNLDFFVQKSFNDKSERVKNIGNKQNIGYLTGSFDAFHFGHINLIRRASQMCDRLIIGIHKDGKRKNVEFVHSLDERISYLKSIRFVDEVIITSGEDDKDWEVAKYNTLFVGSDYQGTERFNKYEITLERKAKIVYLPRTEGVSSTLMREKMIK